MQSEIELKPCPFCAARLERSILLSNRMAECHFHPDTAEGDPCFLNGEAIWVYHDDRANDQVKKWNTRAALEPAPAREPVDGWVMVPREPTEAMLEAARRVQAHRLTIYRAMIAAAPPAPAPPADLVTQISDEMADRLVAKLDALAAKSKEAYAKGVREWRAALSKMEGA